MNVDENKLKIQHVSNEEINNWDNKIDLKDLDEYMDSKNWGGIIDPRHKQVFLEKGTFTVPDNIRRIYISACSNAIIADQVGGICGGVTIIRKPLTIKSGTIINISVSQPQTLVMDRVALSELRSHPSYNIILNRNTQVTIPTIIGLNGQITDKVLSVIPSLDRRLFISGVDDLSMDKDYSYIVGEFIGNGREIDPVFTHYHSNHMSVGNGTIVTTNGSSRINTLVAHKLSEISGLDLELFLKTSSDAINGVSGIGNITSHHVMDTSRTPVAYTHNTQVGSGLVIIEW